MVVVASMTGESVSVVTWDADVEVIVAMIGVLVAFPA
jgi:hypothetical protein